MSATSLTLDQVYQGTTATNSAYLIYQDEYRLFGDVDIEHTFKQLEDNVLMLVVDPADLDLHEPSPNTYDDSLYCAPVGRRQDTYEEGTVSATSATKVITGSSTSWTSVQGLSRGNRIRIGDNVYTVKSVDSDTQLTVYENIVTTVSAGTAYVLFMDNIVVQLFQIPDSIKNLYYRYYRKPAPLVNDYDEPDLPSSYHWLLLQGALSEMWAHKGDDQRRITADASFLAGIQQMKTHYTANRNYERVSSIVGVRRNLRLRYPANFDVSHST